MGDEITQQGAEGTQQGTEPQNQNTGDQSQQQTQQGAETTGKTFTQDDVNAIGAREKNQGKSSILKLFGCADEKSAKAEAEEFKKWKQSQLTAEQKLQEAEKQSQAAITESEQRAIAAENKLSALQAGVNNESLDDALAIALLKVTEAKPLDKVFEEMKKEPRYAGFFGKAESTGSGTGSSANHNRGGQGGTDNYGERLAKNRVNNTPQKSNFFKNN